MKTITKAATSGAAGPPPSGTEVTAHYTGTLESDGSKFDSSRDRGKPFKFDIGAGSVIKGWEEGFASMKVGEKAKLVIRSDYGYGGQAMGEKIPANSNLVFDVELLGFQEKEKQKWEVGTYALYMMFSLYHCFVFICLTATVETIVRIVPSTRPRSVWRKQPSSKKMVQMSSCLEIIQSLQSFTKRLLILLMNHHRMNLYPMPKRTSTSSAGEMLLCAWSKPRTGQRLSSAATRYLTGYPRSPKQTLKHFIEGDWPSYVLVN